MFFLYETILGAEIPGPGEIMRSLGAFFMRFIYSLLTSLYDLFMNVTQVQFLTNDDIQPIYEKVTLILTIVMIFYVTFQTVKYVVEPDKISDKEQGAGKVVVRMILVVVLLATVPTIFEKANEAQGIILRSGVFEKIILINNGENNTPGANYGHKFASELLSIFYYVESGNESKECNVPSGGISPNNCGEVVRQNIEELRTTGNISNLEQGMWEPDSGKPYIEFDWLLGTAVGAFICYMFLMYTIDAGARVAQLAFLQIIAPIPILGYLSPGKDNMFNKWVKQCTTTYIDLFIRVSIIYVVVLITQILGDAFRNDRLINNVDNSSWLMNKFIYLALLIGLFLFAQRAPKMIQELMPSGGSKAAAGDFGLSYKKRNLPAFGRVLGGAVGGAAGAGAGLLTGAIQGTRKKQALAAQGKSKKRQNIGAITGGMHGALKGATGGLTKGMYHGSRKGNIGKNIVKGSKAQIEKNKQFGAKQENGYTLKHQIKDKITETLNLKTRIEKLETTKKPIEAKIKIHQEVFDSFKAIKTEAKKHVVEEGKGKYSAEYKRAEQKVHDLKENAVRLGYVAGGTVNGVTFANQDEADVALSKAQAKAASELDAIEKKAVYDFIKNGEYDAATDTYKGPDKQVQNLQKQLEHKIFEYNETASHDYKLSNVEFKYDETTHETKIFVGGTEMDPKTFNEYTKGLTAENSGELGHKIAEINANITKVKGEIEGTGNTGGSKK